MGMGSIDGDCHLPLPAAVGFHQCLKAVVVPSFPLQVRGFVLAGIEEMGLGRVSAAPAILLPPPAPGGELS